MGIIAYATMDGKYEMTNSPYIIIVPKNHLLMKIKSIV